MAYTPIWLPDYLALFRRTLVGVFDFGGRSARTEMGVYFFIAPLVFALLLAIATIPFNAATIDELLDPLPRALLWVYWLPAGALFFRRAHDIGRSGYWAAGLCILTCFAAALDQLYPSYGPQPFNGAELSIAALKLLSLIGLGFLFLVPGEEDPNRFGPDPRLARTTP